MSMAGKNVSTFVGAIEQLASGAIGQDMSESDYADIIAKNIAYLLFDDYDAIGAGLTNGPTSVHLMNLNGMFLPISTILYALGDALSQDQKITGIVKTSITLPEIKFKTPEDQRSFEQANSGLSAWGAQKTEMLSQGEIETHFLANLRTMLAGMAFR